MRARCTVRFLAPLLLLAACDRSRAAPALEISGDTMIYAALFTLPDGQKNANCGYHLTAHATGGRGDTAIIRQGRVTYSFLETGQTHGTLEWTPERLTTLWANPRIAAGGTEASKPHDISFSLPFHPVRAEVVFDYTVSGDDAVRSTVPFTFSCR